MLIQPSKYSEFETIEKESKIGEGTYAVVYTGIAKKPREKPIKVALKRIKPGQYQEGLDISAIREIKYLKEIQHENVILLFDVVSLYDNLCLVLEFLSSDLEMIIKNTNVVFSAADIKSWMLMLLRGLNAIHSNFILHRVICNLNRI